MTTTALTYFLNFRFYTYKHQVHNLSISINYFNFRYIQWHQPHFQLFSHFYQIFIFHTETLAPKHKRILAFFTQPQNLYKPRRHKRILAFSRSLRNSVGIEGTSEYWHFSRSPSYSQSEVKNVAIFDSVHSSAERDSERGIALSSNLSCRP